jgi:hypothetical protein
MARYFERSRKHQDNDFHVMLAGARVSALLTSTPARLSAIQPLLQALPKCVHEAVVAVAGKDAQSNSATLGFVKAPVRVHWVPVGEGDSLAATLDAAQGDYLILNADHIEGADLFPLLGALLGGAEIAKGARFLQGGTAHGAGIGARLHNNLSIAATRTLFGGHIRDFGCEALAITRSLLEELVPSAHERGADLPKRLFLRALKRGLRVHEVPVRERQHEAAAPPAASLPLLLSERFAVSTPYIGLNSR